MKLKKTNLDAWRLSYEQPQDLFKSLVAQFAESTDKYIDFGDWGLRMPRKEAEELAEAAATEAEGQTEAEATEAEELTEIYADLVLGDGSVLGRFHFNDTAKYRGLAFFTFDNKALYLYRGGCLAMLEISTSELGLRLRTQTQLDVAVDVNFNLYLPLMRLVRDSDHYEMILNGRTIENENRTLQGVGEWFARSRKKRERYPTLYFEHKRFDGLKLRCYDKGKEVEASGKTYILDANGFGKSKTYRFEAVIKWWQFRQFLRYIKDASTDCPLDWKLRPSETDQEHFERIAHQYVESADFALALWDWACGHVLYFRDRRTNEKITMLDLVER